VDNPWLLVQTQSAKVDDSGFYWEFVSDVVPQTEWKLEWPNQTRVDAYGITTSGILYLETRPSTARARAQLAMYPTNLVPENESLCRLAIISIDNFEVARKPNGELYIDDIREIVTQDYEPVANWLTTFWDKQLIGVWEKVRSFVPIFMAPPTLLKSSYFDLEAYGIDVNSNAPPLPPEPPKPTRAQLVSASVSATPPIPVIPSLIGVTVTLAPPTASPVITDLTLEVLP
jgi:hypothetical protein